MGEVEEAVEEEVEPIFDDDQQEAINDQISYMLRPLTMRLNNIEEFDQDTVKPLLWNARKIEAIVQEQLWINTRLEAIEQFLADICPEKYRNHFNQRVNRIETMNPAANNAGQALTLAGTKQETEGQRITKAENQKRLERSGAAMAIASQGGDGTKAYSAIPGYRQDEDGNQVPEDDEFLGIEDQQEST